MKIRTKLLSVVLPVLVGSLLLVGVSSYYLASSAVSKVSANFLSFKAFELEKYAESQWALLVENQLLGRIEMLEAAKLGVASFAQTITRSSSESIFATDKNGQLAFQTKPNWSFKPNEASTLMKLLENLDSDRLYSFSLDGIERMGIVFRFEPFDWLIFVTNQKSVFYEDIDKITFATLSVLAGSTLLGLILLVFLLNKVTTPLVRFSTTMQRIIQSGDINVTVPVEYNDEIGTMSHTFNLMLKELENAHSQIKKYALSAVISQKKEMKIRHIFQKYVPQDLIDRFYKNPESMLVGENRQVVVFFSDIRSFTTISELLSPEELVKSLNKYFALMVDIIMGRGGIIDKYIGDAIMAFFGAPVKHEDDVQQSIESALDMIDGLKIFNRQQKEIGAPEFHIGIGINFGDVTVGNIGSEKKMDYTVIGDTVNLASRLESQTKDYGETLIISESVTQKLNPTTPVRFLDKIAVKGKKQAVKIYTVSRDLDPEQLAAWKTHNDAMELYYQRNFESAINLFEMVKDTLGETDQPSKMMIERSKNLLRNSPPPNWDGVEVKKEK